jgi:hypothetical protein
MAEKKTAKKEKIESSKVDLKEILGDIKTVVSGEKETLFKVSEYKTINLTKKNLVESGKKNISVNVTSIDDGKLENLIRSIVKDEIRSFQRGQKIAKVSTENTKAKKKFVSNSSQLEEKIKPISVLNKMTKKELEDYGRTFGFEVDRRLTKDKIINQVKKLK